MVVKGEKLPEKAACKVACKVTGIWYMNSDMIDAVRLAESGQAVGCAGVALHKVEEAMSLMLIPPSLSK